MINMLKKKITAQRLKPKAIKIPKYLKWLHEVEQPECFVCHLSSGIQLHHVKRYSSDNRDDDKVIPLCYDHHLGTEFSVHNNSVEFREIYTMEEQLASAKELYTKYKETI